MRIKPTLALAAFLVLVSLVHARAGDAAPSYVELQDAPAIAVDWSKGNVQAVTLHGNRTLTFSGGQKGGKYLLILKQDATGSRTVTWPSSVHWTGGGSGSTGAPTITTTANRKDYLSIFCDGVSYDVLALSQDH